MFRNKIFLKVIKVFAFAFLVILVKPCDGQGFQKLYGGGSFDEGTDLVEVSTGGFLAVGNTSNYNGPYPDFYAIKMHSNGDTIWTRVLGSNASEDYCAAAVEALDGGFLLVGSTASFGQGDEDVLVIKIDSMGSEEWSLAVGGVASDMAEDVVQLANGNFIIIGHTTSFGQGSRDYYLINISSVGNVNWTKTYGGSAFDYGKGITVTSDENVVIVGESNSYGSGNDKDALVMKIDPATGNSIWYQVFGSTNQDYPQKVMELLDGNLLITGTTKGGGSQGLDVLAVIMEQSGSILHSVVVGGSSSDYAYQGAQSSDGSIYITGETYSYDQGNGDVYFMKLDLNLNLVWANAVGRNGLEESYAVINKSDGSNYVLGRTQSFASSDEMYLLKFDSLGNAGNCFTTNANSSTVNPFIHSVFSAVVNTSSGGIPIFVSSQILSTNTNVRLASLSLSGSITDVDCNGNNTGSVDVTVIGGTGPFTYFWSSGESTEDISNLYSGNFSLSATDNFGCTTSGNFVVEEPLAVNLNVSQLTDASCSISCDASAEVSVNGGVSPYTYQWASGSNDSTSTGLCVGNSLVTVTDNNNCLVFDSVYIDHFQFVPEICLVTVDSFSSRNVVVWTKPQVLNIDSFKIYREITNNYVSIGSVAYSDSSHFVDVTNGINPNVTSYRYKLSIIDTCGVESPLSDFHETVHMSAAYNGSIIDLGWDNYEGFNFGFYYITMDTIGNGDFYVKDSVSSFSTSWSDNNVPNTAYLSYLIQVVPITPCEVTRTRTHNSSRSNTRTMSNTGIGIKSHSELSQLKIYPNPNKGSFQIHLSNHNFKDSPLILYGSTGQVIKEWNNSSFIENDVNYFEVKNLNSGVYWLEIKLKNEILREKLIINNVDY